MGCCVSAPKERDSIKVRARSSGRKSFHHRGRGAKRKDPLRVLSDSRLVENSDRFYVNPTSQGSHDESWYDSTAILDSDCDEDYQSVQDDMASFNAFDGLSMPIIPSLRDANVGESIAHGQGTSTSETVNDSNSRSPHSNEHLHPKSDGPPTEEKKPAHPVEIYSSGEEDSSQEEGMLDNCGIIPNNCLPCLASAIPQTEKKRSLNDSPQNSKKKAAIKLSFKWRDGHANGALLSSKMLLRRPLAGSQVPLYLIGKTMLNCWSPVEPSTFKVRGENYFRDKKKVFAPNYAAYSPFGVDVFLSPRKISHISRFVELPNVNSSGKLPSILVINVQVPIYPATFFQSETDGEGICFVLYFKVSDRYVKELPSHFQENIRRLIDDEVEKVKGFAVDTIVPFRERLKILGRLVNVEELLLSAAERKIIHAYNEKPVLSRPQHEFYLGGNYLEIDIDMHRFGYISRMGFGVFLDRLRLCVLDIGLTIQGNKAEELPEQILCCVQLNRVDYKNYQQLGMN